MATTKKQAGMIDNYRFSTKRSLVECYNSFSIRKAQAYMRCLESMHTLGGWDFRICSHNTNFFTCAYQYTDPEDGNIKLMYHTASNDYSMDYNF